MATNEVGNLNAKLTADVSGAVGPLVQLESAWKRVKRAQAEFSQSAAPGLTAALPSSQVEAAQRALSLRSRAANPNLVGPTGYSESDLKAELARMVAARVEAARHQVAVESRTAASVAAIRAQNLAGLRAETAATKKLAEAVDYTSQPFHRITRAQAALNRGQLAGSKAASRFGVVMQQAGYQAQDFAVQVAGGQNKLVAFTQQASQMLGFFGPVGAIAGATLAVGALVYRVMDIGAASKKAASETQPLLEVLKSIDNLRKEQRFEGLPIAGQVEDVRKQIQAQTALEQNARRYAGLLLKYRGVGVTDGAGGTLTAEAQELKAAEAVKRRVELEGQLNSLLKKQREEAVEKRKEQARGNAEWQRMLDDNARRAREDREGRTKEAEAIRDQLNPMREKLRTQQKINALVQLGYLTEQERGRFIARQNLMESASLRLPDSFNNTGAFASGGLAGAPVTQKQQVDLLKDILVKLREMRQDTAEMAGRN